MVNNHGGGNSEKGKPRFFPENPGYFSNPGNFQVMVGLGMYIYIYISELYIYIYLYK